MQKWVYERKFGTHNPICYDLGEITSFELVPTMRSLIEENEYCTDVWLTYVVADGIRYVFTSMISSMRIYGLSSCLPVGSADGPFYGERLYTDGEYHLPSGLKDGDLIDGRKLRYKNYIGEKSIIPHCCDPRVLAMRSITWSNGEHRPPVKTKDLLALVDSVPTREEALDYLRRNEFAETAMTEEEVCAKMNEDPQWEGRIFRNCKDVKF